MLQLFSEERNNASYCCLDYLTNVIEYNPWAKSWFAHTQYDFYIHCNKMSCQSKGITFNELSKIAVCFYAKVIEIAVSAQIFGDKLIQMKNIFI